jgi:hypothetical protein
MAGGDAGQTTIIIIIFKPNPEKYRASTCHADTSERIIYCGGRELVSPPTKVAR